MGELVDIRKRLQSALATGSDPRLLYQQGKAVAEKFFWKNSIAAYHWANASQSQHMHSSKGEFSKFALGGF